MIHNLVTYFDNYCFECQIPFMQGDTRHDGHEVLVNTVIRNDFVPIIGIVSPVSISTSYKMPCGCKVHFTQSGQMGGADFCDNHILIFGRLAKLEAGKSADQPPDITMFDREQLGEQLP